MLYEDLVGRALAAAERSQALAHDSRRLAELGAVLREADVGTRMLRRCAWCGRFEVGDEWLHLDGIGSGQIRLTARLTRYSTNGICPDCFEQLRDVSAQARQSRPAEPDG